MMKKICLYLLLFFISNAVVYSQTIDVSIKKIITASIPDSVKIKTLIDSSYKYALSGEAVALLFINAANEIVKNQPLSSVIILVSQLNNSTGTYYMNIGKYDSATFYYSKNLSLGEKYKNDLIIAKAYNNLGNIGNYTAEYQQSIGYNLKALKYFEKVADEEGSARVYGNLANSFIRLQQSDKAVTFLNKAIAITEKKNDKRLLANLYNTLATAYGDLKNDSFLFYQIRSYNLYKEINNLKGLTTTSINLGQIYQHGKKTDSAIFYFTQGVKFASANEDIQNLGELYFSMAVLYYDLKDSPKALTTVDSAIAFCLQSGDRLILSQAYKKKSEILYDLNNFKGGYDYFKQYSNLNDSIFNENMQTSVAEMQTKYETEKKERKIEEQKFELLKKTYWIIGIGIVLAALILLTISHSRRYKLQQERRLQTEIIKQQDIATKAIIEAEENERKRIAGDLHDGVGQLMSAAKMNLSSFESRSHFKSEEDKLAFEKIISLVDESCKEVRNVSHNMMPNALLKSGLSSAVKEFIDKIDHSVLKVNLYSEGLNERLDSNVETVLYRVIQECVNNVIKHSGANQLDISLIRDSDGISTTIEDNGSGFNTDAKQRFDGIGLKNIIARVSYLKGTVDFDSSPDEGTLVAIHVPLN